MKLLLVMLAIPAFCADPPAAVRRLTHSQYNHTVRDLLGDETRPADAFPQEDFVNGFKNQIAAQDISPLLAEAYNAAAERMARTAFPGGEDVNHLLPCAPSEPSCGARFVRQFGAKVFRRPLNDAEVRRYAALFKSGAPAAIEAMLQSPKFLFRTEQGAYATASRLSYFLWDSMPDAELFRAAASGELGNRAGVAKQVRRMIADPRARDMLDEFVSEWLRFDLVLNAVKDRATYPQFTPELAAAMTEETRRLIADTVWNGGNFMEIFTAAYAFVNSDLAAIYKVPAPAVEFGKVTLPPESGRAGLLGEALFLTMTSKPADTSPTVRGLTVREHFLCQIVPDPPPGTNSNLPPVTPDAPMTNRERLKVHATNTVCAGCHGLMDPVGFGLEKFDGIGRYREKQTIRFEPDRRAKNQKPTSVARDLDTHGSVLGIPDSAFSSPGELGRILAGSKECQECVVKQLFRYAYGRKETSADAALLDRANANFRDSHFRLKELIMFLAEEMN
jgi:Protein of unknown function (DUF1592)/Protein of unknown function (DUF1588)/Protein of unknown function (DUF1587)/Protein of unknown function (DUF1595)/Protein of unknown function (DUF1585)